MTTADQDAQAPRFEQPLVSVDVVPLWISADGALHITLGRRLNAPARGELALPGVLMGRERSVDAAGRALRGKVGIDPSALVLRDIGVFDAPTRDPRGPTMAIAKAGIGPASALAARPSADGGSAADAGTAPDAGAASGAAGLPGAELAASVRVDELPALPFDHAAVIASALRALGTLVWSDREVCRALLGEEPTTRAATAVQRQLEIAAGQEPKADASNMKRRLLALGWMRPTDRAALPEGATGRPSTVWEWIG
ncbi:hypothetical protein ACXET9_14640 [Brachybacterium sp. DNPG3]